MDINNIDGFFYSCNGQEIEFESHESKHTTNELISKLDSAYVQKDTCELIEFFNRWTQDVKENEFKYVNQNKWIQSIYDIYKTFYIPSSPFDLGNWEAFHIPENSLEYFLIQNKIFYSIIPDNDFKKLT